LRPRRGYDMRRLKRAPTPCRQHCREQPKPKPSKTRDVDTVDTGIEATILDAGRVPLASATGKRRVPRRERSANCAWHRERALLD